MLKPKRKLDFLLLHIHCLFLLCPVPPGHVVPSVPLPHDGGPPPRCRHHHWPGARPRLSPALSFLSPAHSPRSLPNCAASAPGHGLWTTPPPPPSPPRDAGSDLPHAHLPTQLRHTKLLCPLTPQVSLASFLEGLVLSRKPRDACHLPRETIPGGSVYRDLSRARFASSRRISRDSTLHSFFIHRLSLLLRQRFRGGGRRLHWETLHAAGTCLTSEQMCSMGREDGCSHLPPVPRAESPPRTMASALFSPLENCPSPKADP